MTGLPAYHDGLRRGREAHAAGIGRAPTLDPSAVATIAIAGMVNAGLSVGTDYYRGWLDGWDLANLIADTIAEDNDDDEETAP